MAGSDGRDFGTIFAAYFCYSVVVLTNPCDNTFIFISKYSKYLCVVGDKEMLMQMKNRYLPTKKVGGTDDSILSLATK